MKHRQAAVIILLLVVWMGGVMSVEGADEPSSVLQHELRVSASLKSAKIVVVRFFPLRGRHLGSLHERVFTDELYSDNPAGADITGWFVPRNHTDMIRDSFAVVGKLYGLDIDTVDDIGEVPEGADCVVLGMVRDFRAGGEAKVCFDIRLLRGKSLEISRDQTFACQIKTDDVPFITSHPIHMIGNHALDYHPQRTMLSAATYLTVLDVFEWIDKESQGQ